MRFFANCFHEGIQVIIYSELIFKCYTVCDGNTFGQDCGEECGECVNDEQCHHINGTCLNGCKRGYKGQQCKQGNIQCIHDSMFAFLHVCLYGSWNHLYFFPSYCRNITRR